MQLERECDECATRYVAQTKRSRFCSAACRVKANRRPVTQGMNEGEPPVAAPERGGLVSQVAADLQKVGVLDTIPGRAALALAYRIESPMETGSAAASMTRELSRLVDEAKALTPKQQDGIDKLDDSVGAKLRLVK